MRQELLSINESINSKLLQSFYADTLSDFLGVYREQMYYINVLYQEGVISHDIANYFRRKCRSYRNTYKSIHVDYNLYKDSHWRF